MEVMIFPSVAKLDGSNVPLFHVANHDGVLGFLGDRFVIRREHFLKLCGLFQSINHLFQKLDSPVLVEFVLDISLLLSVCNVLSQLPEGFALRLLFIELPKLIFLQAFFSFVIEVLAHGLEYSLFHVELRRLLNKNVVLC